MIKRTALACLVAMSALSPTPLSAHPHVWADVKVRVLFDDKGQVRALHQYWLFDDYYSAFVLSGADMNGRAQRNFDLIAAIAASDASHSRGTEVEIAYV